MDQKRFISFLMLSVAVLLLAQIVFRPPQKPQPAPAADAAADGKEADKAAADDAGPRPDEPNLPGAIAPGRLPELAPIDAKARYITIGSLDPETGYRMLVTLTSTGAAVWRAEMSSPRYLDQHDWSGYMGELELVDAEGGAQVQVVGQGTPAAAATGGGIKAGDVIVGIKSSSEQVIKTVEDFRNALAETRPGQDLGLQVRRGDGAAEWRTVKLARRPFAVVRPESDNYRMRGVDTPPGFENIPSFLLSLNALNGKPLDEPDARRMADVLEKGDWRVTEEDDQSVTFVRPLPEVNLEIAKKYTLKPVPAEQRGDRNYPGYDVQLDVEIRNTADAPQTGVAYRMLGPTGMPIEGWWYAHKISQRWFASAGLRDVEVRFDGSQSLQIDGPLIAKGPIEPMGQDKSLAYAGVEGLYFSAMMIPLKQSLSEVWFDTTEAIVVGPPPDPKNPTFTNVSCRLNRKPVDLAAGGKLQESFQVFMGPNRPDLLFQYRAAGDENYSLRDILYYGWPIFAAVAKAMLAILHFFYGWVGNYGIAIIMLTVVVRGALFPISYKQTQNMARMQALKPEMDRITEKYKTDMQKRSQAMQELYRKHKINPLGGCLPLFLQLPIFIGLYRSLAVDVELRQSPLFGSAIRWCSNLAAPDMLLNWSAVMPDFVTSGQGIFGLGPYLNILPLVTVGLFLVTQKMAMPEPTNEQAVMQQKMMKYMTLFMGLLFYKVASGLCLYFIASSLWGIGERKLLPKAKTTDSAATGGIGGTTPGASGKRPDGGGSKPGSNGSPGSRRPPKAKRK